MNSSRLEASVRRRGGAALIDLRGEINAQGEEALNQAYAEATSQDPSNVIVNFSQVDYINSTGIALIVGLLGQERRASRKLMAYGLSDHYLEIFQITRLAEFMSIFPDEDSALTSLSVQSA